MPFKINPVTGKLDKVQDAEGMEADNQTDFVPLSFDADTDNIVVTLENDASYTVDCISKTIFRKMNVDFTTAGNTVIVPPMPGRRFIPDKCHIYSKAMTGLVAATYVFTLRFTDTNEAFLYVSGGGADYDNVDHNYLTVDLAVNYQADAYLSVDLSRGIYIAIQNAVNADAAPKHIFLEGIITEE